MLNFFKNIFSSGDDKEKNEDSCPCDSIKCYDKIVLKFSENALDCREGEIVKVKDDSFQLKLNYKITEISFQPKQKLFASITRNDKSAKFFTDVIEINDRTNSVVLEMTMPEKLDWLLSRRRIHERVKIKLNVRAKSKKAKKAEWYSIRVTDLSIGGIGFISPFPFPLDDHVDLDFMRPDFPAKLTAVVRRVCSNDEKETWQQFNYKGGMEFINPDARAKSRLNRIIEAIKARKQ